MPVEEAENLHKSVMPSETLALLSPNAGEIFVDATVGFGGHTELILNASESVKVIAIDQDRQALELAKARLGVLSERVTFVQSNFSEIRTVLEDLGISEVDGILADLGVSSIQLDDPERGFSFRFDAPLDMRMDQDSESETAAQMLERLSEFEIARIIYEYGEERHSRRIARRIVEKRDRGEPVLTTRELAQLVEKCVKRGKKDKVHPATKTFQALRIAVNNELGILKDFINDCVELLKPGGRLCLITFHSLEDRIVKQLFQNLAGKCSCPPRMPVCICGAEKKIEILTRKPFTAGIEELDENPRSRSAKLRGCRKLD